MKQYAYCRDPAGDRLIHVWEAERLRTEMPERYRSLRFFSTEADPAKRHEMVLVHREETMFFRYKEMPAKGTASEAESLTHILAKQTLCSRELLKLALPEGELLLWVKDWQTEVRLLPDGKNTVVADLMASLYAARPKKRVARWDPEVLVEITVTHDTTPQKIALLRAAGKTVLEVVIDDGLRVPESLSSTEEEVMRAEARLKEALCGSVPARILTEPETPAQKLARRMKRAWNQLIEV